MKFRKMQLFILFLLFFSTNYVRSAKILGVFPMVGTSHYLAGKTLMNILTDAGHQVTLISPFRENKSIKNFKSVQLSGLLEELEETRHNIFKFQEQGNPFLDHLNEISYSYKVINDTIINPVFKEFIKTNESFDLIILEHFFADGLMFLKWYYKVPIILYSAIDASYFTNHYVANPSPSSYITDLCFPFESDMSFFQRMQTFLFAGLTHFSKHLIEIPNHFKIIKDHFPDLPDLNTIMFNVSLIFLNSDLSVNRAVPKVPNMIDIGGFHIDDPKPLPLDLQSILDNAQNGVIYFSMGSNLRSQDMPAEMKELFLKTFAKLKETVIWKFEQDDLPEKPRNVEIRKWIPQQDLLAHKNVKLFITHGGIFSTMETVRRGVPVLCVPVFGDQQLNSIRSVQSGFAEMVKLQDLPLKFESTLQKMLGSSKYRENAQKLSKLMADQLVNPRDKIKFYVDYVLRHNGAHHLQVAGIRLSWYQYFCVDVILFLAIVFIIFIFVTKTCIVLIFKKIKQCSNAKRGKDKVQ